MSSLPFYQSSLLKIPHGMFTRLGGVSQPPYSSLNIGSGVGDESENVSANRERIRRELGLNFLLTAKQVHGDRVYCATGITRDTEVEGYDAFITDQPGVGLLVQQADCQAILLYDPQNKVIGAVHNGWRGSVADIIGTTIATMQNEYGVNSASLVAALSPSLGPCCAEFVNYRQELPRDFHGFRNDRNQFNFWDISVSQLVQAGVVLDKIEIAGICTSCDQNYFSYRRSMRLGNGKTGRQCSVIGLSVV